MRSVLDAAVWRRVLIVFLVCKVGAFVVGAVAVPVMEYPRQLITAHQQLWPDELSEDTFGPVRMWEHFDSEHYIALVDRDYLAPLTPTELADVRRAAAGEVFPVSSSLHRFTFGPMYPLLGKVLAPVLGASVSLWVISNLAMIACLFFFHELTASLFGGRADPARPDPGQPDPSPAGPPDEVDTARPALLSPDDALTWLVVLPSAFLLQAVLTESLFLAFVLGAFWLAERRRWGWAIVPAIGLALTRSSGFVVCLPLALVALRQAGWRFDRSAWGTYLRATPAIAAAPLAWAAFLGYCWAMTGDALAYSHLQHAGWGVTFGPPTGFFEAFTEFGRPSVKALSVLVMGALLLAGARLVPLAYQVLGWLLLLVPLMISEQWQQSIWRYAVEVFPIAWVLARHLRTPGPRTAGIAVSSALQGVLLLAWLVSWTKMIV